MYWANLKQIRAPLTHLILRQAAIVNDWVENNPSYPVRSPFETSRARVNYTGIV